MSQEPGRRFSVRPATPADADLLLTWRNDPSVRAWSRSAAAIDATEHTAWLVAALADPDRHVLVAVDEDGVPAATTRYELLPDPTGARSRSRWEISIAVAPGLRGRGVGSAALTASDRWLWTTEPEADEIVAWVRSGNAASRKLFEGQGYTLAVSEGDDMTCYVARPPGSSRAAPAEDR
jgi:RimJ/RimL family protein N-acetyltransferase